MLIYTSSILLCSYCQLYYYPKVNRKDEEEEKKSLLIRSHYTEGEKVEVLTCSLIYIIHSTQLIYKYMMTKIFTIFILGFLPIYTAQILSVIKDPFEYFKKLALDAQNYPQCDRIPPFKTQLDPSFFDIDLRQWQRKKDPPPIHRTLEAFVQLDTLRQSTYFSHILQGNSQAKVPGI